MSDLTAADEDPLGEQRLLSIMNISLKIRSRFR
jgi:hypothetical protein